MLSIREATPEQLPSLQEIDAAACSVFDAIGLHVNLPKDHAFVVAEAQRWGRALAASKVWIATGEQGSALGFAVLGRQDAAPYLDQLAVRPEYMRKGIGSALLREVISASAPGPLWLTTYAHVAWNAPYYVRFGFERVDDAACGAELQQTLADQRAVLPFPDQRVAMVRR